MSLHALCMCQHMLYFDNMPIWSNVRKHVDEHVGSTVAFAISFNSSSAFRHLLYLFHSCGTRSEITGAAKSFLCKLSCIFWESLFASLGSAPLLSSSQVVPAISPSSSVEAPGAATWHVVQL